MIPVPYGHIQFARHIALHTAQNTITIAIVMVPIVTLAVKNHHMIGLIMIEERNMAQLDPNPIPPWAVTMWYGDDGYIYCALPMTKGGVPYITRYLASEGGLTAALSVLRKRKHEVLSPIDAQALYHPPTQQPMVKLSKAQEKLHAETTEAQRESARKLIAKMGIK